MADSPPALSPRASVGVIESTIDPCAARVNLCPVVQAPARAAGAPPLRTPARPIAGDRGGVETRAMSAPEPPDEQSAQPSSPKRGARAWIVATIVLAVVAVG